MSGTEAHQEQGPGSEEQPAPDAPESRKAPRPDQVAARGNPEVETIDVDRGLDKMDRVSGN